MTYFYPKDWILIGNNQQKGVVTMSETKVKSNPKHLQISTSVRQLERAVTGLEKFVNGIENVPEKSVEDESDVNEPSLVSVLINTPEQIDVCTKRIEQMIEQLQAQLY